VVVSLDHSWILLIANFDDRDREIADRTVESKKMSAYFPN